MRIRLSLFPNTPKEKLLIQNQTYDYVKSLKESVFCAHAAGVAGWSYRLQEIIYAGCIPVIFTDYTHYPHYELINYKKFAVLLRADDIGNLENILLSYSREEIAKKQLVSLRIRDAFYYEVGPDGSNNVTENALKEGIGAAFFTFLALRLRLDTRFD
jgi:hypothetical protein